MRGENLSEQNAMSKDAQKRAQKAQTRQSARTRLAFLAAAGMILAVEIYIAICVKGSFVRHYAGTFWQLSCFTRLCGLFLASRRQI